MMEQEAGTSGYMAMMHVNVVIPRLVCACLMHLLMEPEVRQALAMLKYVINHKKVRGSLVNLTDKIFRKHIYFLRDSSQKPSEYLYVKYSDVRQKSAYINAKEFECTDSKGNKVMVPIEKIKGQRFKLSKIGKEIKMEDL
jgi:hypothetical protein